MSEMNNHNSNKGSNNGQLELMHATQRDFNEALTPRERLMQLANLASAVSQTELGIGYHEGKDGRPELVFSHPTGEGVVTVPTKISKAEFDRILDKVLPLEETKLMLSALAQAYEQKTPIMLEGGTALGKTFVVNTFAKLLYGEKSVIPDFYCSGQTDVSELMGKYIPAGLKPDQIARVESLLKSEAGAALKDDLMKETGGSYEYKELFTRACAAAGVPVNESTFEFQLGVLPKAMTAGHDAQGRLHYTGDGPGVMLHIQEVGMAAPSVVNALLKARGDQGRLAESIQVWEDGGRLIKGGPGFFMVYSTNPAGKGYQERFEVDKALARSLVWVNLPERLSDESMRKACSMIFSCHKLPPQKNTVIDISKNEELGQVLGGVMAKFHKVYSEMLEQGETGRKQKVPPTLDSLWRVAELVQENQVPTKDFKSIDMVETIKKAVQSIYINCLQDKKLPFEQRGLGSADKTIGDKLMDSLGEILSNSATAQIDFRGRRTTPAEAIKTLATEAMSAGAAKPEVKQVESMRSGVKREGGMEAVISTLEIMRSTMSRAGWESLYKNLIGPLSKEEKEIVRQRFHN